MPRFSVWLIRFLKIILIGAAASYLAAYTYIALSRLTYPFELEWMEGGALIQVARILAGEPLYTRPAADYVAFIYPPLYFYLSALTARLVGVGFTALRLVSFTASLVCFLSIYLIVKRETGSWFPGLLASGLFAATFRLTGAWFDIARVDTLFIMFCLAALWSLGLRTRLSSMVAGICFALSFLTKQTAIGIIVPVAIGVFFVDRRLAFYLTASVTLVAALATAGLELYYGDWYRFYVFELPARHLSGIAPLVGGESQIGPVPPLMLGAFDILILVLIPLGIAHLIAFAFMSVRDRRSPTQANRLVLLAAWAGMYWTTLGAKANPASFTNAFIPACAGLCLVFGIGLARIIKTIDLSPPNQKWWQAAGIYAICGAQFALLAYDVGAQLPAQADLEAGRQIVDLIKQTPGEVYIPRHGYLAFVAGKQSYAHPIALGELRGAFGGPALKEWDAIHNEIAGRIRSRAFELIIAGERGEWPEIGEFYIRTELSYGDSIGPWMVWGREDTLHVYRPP